MLILVGVSVSVALQGGLFTKAKTASDDTKEAVIREQLQDIILGKLDVNNNTIPEDLGEITLDGVTYNVTAQEEETASSTPEIKINIVLAADGKEPITYDLKIGGIKEITTAKAEGLEYGVLYGSFASEYGAHLNDGSWVSDLGIVPSKFVDIPGLDAYGDLCETELCYIILQDGRVFEAYPYNPSDGYHVGDMGIPCRIEGNKLICTHPEMDGFTLLELTSEGLIDYIG